MPTDLSNWRDYPNNIWGFRNADKIVPTLPIRKAQEAPPFEDDIRKFDNFKMVDPDGTTMNLASFLSATETDGIVVLKHGKTVFEHYDRTNTSQSKHALFSISKSVTGLVCGILVEQGKLTLEAPVSKYVPEIAGSSFQNLTVRQLLDMRAGLNYKEGESEYRKATGMVPLKPGEEPTNLHDYIPSVNAPKSAPVEGLEGPPFQYLSINADLIGWVIEKACGEKFAQTMTRLIWQPMGAENDSYTMVDPAGNARTAAGLCATVRDVARLGQLIASPRAKGIIPESWIQDTVSNGSREAYVAGSEEKEFEGIFSSVAYRNFWIADKESETMMASGTNGQILLVDRKAGVVLAKTSSQPDRTNWDKIRLTLRALRELERILE